MWLTNKSKQLLMEGVTVQETVVLMLVHTTPLEASKIRINMKNKIFAWKFSDLFFFKCIKHIGMHSQKLQIHKIVEISENFTFKYLELNGIWNDIYIATLKIYQTTLVFCCISVEFSAVS